jgi:hypothetical protein
MVPDSREIQFDQIFDCSRHKILKRFMQFEPAVPMTRGDAGMLKA